MTYFKELGLKLNEHHKTIKSKIDAHNDASDIHVTSTAKASWNAAATNSHTHTNKTILDNTTASYTTEEQSKLEGIAVGANKYSHPTSAGNKHIPTGGASGQILRWSASGTAVWGDENNTTYSEATTSTAGLMSSTDKSKLDGITAGANKYTHPSYTAKSSGLYKVTVDASGHVSATTAVAKSDITGLGIPAQDTTYSNFVKSGSGAKAGLVPAPSTTAGTSKYLREDGTWTAPPNSSAATQSAAGLMSAADKKKLDGVATGANKITVDTALSSTSTNPVQNKVVYTGLSGKAPTSHASTATTYGAGTASNYGHVKLSDNYTSSAGAASAGVAASSKALSDAYNACNNKLKWLELPSCMVTFLKTGFTDTSSSTYGVTIRVGNSSMDNYVDDTYYLTILSDGTLKTGCQLNGAKKPTWYTK